MAVVSKSQRRLITEPAAAKQPRKHSNCKLLFGPRTPLKQRLDIMNVYNAGALVKILPPN